MKAINRIFFFIFLIIAFACNNIAPDNSKPNILIINVDDLGWRDVGFMGSEFYETPVLDKMAAGGMIFTRAYASAANCAPSRACMMSGQYTPRHGIYTVNSSERGSSEDRKLIPVKNKTILADSCYTLAEALHDAGYLTCHAGKWHLGESPLIQGFDINIGGSDAGNPGSYYPPYKRVPLDAPSEDYCLTNLIMDKVLEFVESTNDRPFFLYYSPYAVHTPIQPVEKLLHKYSDKEEWNGQNNIQYATMIENLDIQIGRLVDMLKSEGKLSNTFIIFTSDNGGVYRITKQWPLRAGKGSYYEGGIREPTFVYWEEKIKAGEINETPVMNIDFFPTIIEVAGLDYPDDKILDGRSILSALTKSETMDERPLFWHFPVYLEGGNRETADSVFRTRPGSAVIYGDWKLIEYFEDNDFELYNLKNDIGEKTNVADQEIDKFNELYKLLTEWRSETRAPLPTDKPPE